jgi:hypothetical protein
VVVGFSSVAFGCSSLSSAHRVVLSGAVETADGDAVGPVTFSVHHAWLGEGLLRHPMALVEQQRGGDPGAFSLTVDVPTDEGGEGLVLYAWHDRDHDGVLCSMDGDRTELAGAVLVSGWPTHEATLSLRLDEPCAGPETFVFDHGRQRSRGSTFP